MPGALLHCPIRGLLDVTELAADGLRFTEEKRRIDLITFLLEKGYPASHFKIEPVILRFGNAGRNSFRADLAVFDVPANSVPADAEEQRKHIRLVAEVKRDNAEASSAVSNQLKPALDMLANLAAYGVYWDDEVQRLFYKTLTGTKSNTHEQPLNVLPMWGTKLSSARLTRSSLRSGNIRKVFEKIEDRLHAEVQDKDARFEVMLQLLLTKLYDEHTTTKPGAHMQLQDFTDMPISDDAIVAVCDGVLARAAKFYGKYLPKEVSPRFSVSAPMLRSLLAILAPICVIGTKRSVVQDFYMYFAQGVYRWDLAQYFTPTEVVDFIVGLTNPRAGDSVRDPACGSGDFLISALHYAREEHEADISDAIWGADNSPNAVQVCVLNMVLNGGGKSNIAREDSLVEANRGGTYSTVLCNPPFGIKIVEKRFDVLRQFDLGHAWGPSDKGGREKTSRVLGSQEAGLLFAELCVRQTEPGGRIGIILPNGYLGNKSDRYRDFREWLLRHVRVAAIVGFPRFTFKKAGADVSASVLLLEKRDQPLARAGDTKNYPLYVGLLESVGWKLGDKRAEPVFRRVETTGNVLLGQNNEPELDADFDRLMEELYTSNVVKAFPWLIAGLEPPKSKQSWSVSIRDLLTRSDLSLDPKRWCRRVADTRLHIQAGQHFKIGDVAEVVSTRSTPAAKDDMVYHYVEIDNVSEGIAVPQAMYGWELPDRAKNGVKPGEVFVGSIWSSVSKWFVAGAGSDGWRASNGFLRLRIMKGEEGRMLDLVAGLNTEAYRIQARAFCTGSDGLASLSAEDVGEIVLPVIQAKEARSLLEPMVAALLAGRSTIAATLAQLQKDGTVPGLPVKPRTSHVVQV